MLMTSPAAQVFRTVGAVVLNAPAFVAGMRVQSRMWGAVELSPAPMPRRPVADGGHDPLHDAAYTPATGTVRPVVLAVIPPVRSESDEWVTRVHVDVVGVC